MTMRHLLGGARRAVQGNQDGRRVRYWPFAMASEAATFRVKL